MKLYLVRHGETEWNRLGRFQGQEDTELNERGISQAQETAKEVAKLEPTAIYSSPLIRTIQVAQKISSLVNLPVTPVDGLKELSLGDLEGVTGEEMSARWSEIHRSWRLDPGHTVMPQGESIAQLQERAWQSVLKIEKCHTDQDRLVIVSHNFAIRAIITRMLGVPLENFHRMYLSLGSISAIDYSQHNPRLLSYNSTSHLSPENR